jgi:uncharacterized protein YukE
MIFMFVRPVIAGVTAAIKVQKSMADTITSAIASYPPKVMSSWKGGDEEAFQNVVTTQLVPAMKALAEAIAGINTSFDKSESRADQLDSKVKSMAEKLRGTFSSI